MDFSTWQEHKHSNNISTQEDGSGPQAELTQEVMVSPSQDAPSPFIVLSHLT